MGNVPIHGDRTGGDSRVSNQSTFETPISGCPDVRSSEVAESQKFVSPKVSQKAVSATVWNKG